MLISIEKNKLERIFCVTSAVLCLAMLTDKSGISVKLMAPTIVEGKNSNGNAIPITMPYKLIACSLVCPDKTNIKGNNTAIKG